MSVTSHPTARAFLDVIEPEIATHEVEHHLMLGVARGTVEQARAGAFLTVGERDRLSMAAFMTPPRPLILSSIAEADAAGATAEIARWLAAHDRAPTGFIADEQVADIFRAEWCRLTASQAKLRMHQRLFVLRSVEDVPRSPGILRAATLDELPLLEAWTIAFHGEALGEANDPELRERVVHRIESGELYLWIDGEPRSMAASARPTARGIAHV